MGKRCRDSEKSIVVSFPFIWLVLKAYTLVFAQKTFLSLAIIVPVVFFFRNGRKKRDGRGDQWKIHGL